MKIYTIGFAGKKEDMFFDILESAGVKTLADIRLWRTARFVPWASGKNLQEKLGNKYKNFPELAPTKELLETYKNNGIDWTGYEQILNNILKERKVEKFFIPEMLDGICFLCTEKLPDQCHRRLVAEYLLSHFPDVEIIHL